MVLSMTRGTESIIRDAILRKELEELTNRQAAFKQFRDYFDGEQPLAFSTELFQKVFGSAFAGFKDNWMRPIVDVVQDKMLLEGFKAREDDAQSAIEKVWEAFLLNDIDEEMFNLHESALVEGQSFMIVWPDDELGVTIDHQPAGLVRVRYDNDRRRKALWALKRWQTDEGAIFVTIYTPTDAWKFVQRDENDANLQASSKNALLEIPNIGFVSGLTQRDVPDEPFPLPHSFGEVPVVELNNPSYRSELKDAIPQQDALNKVLLDLLVATEFSAVPQKWIEMMGNEPVGGWKTGAGQVWHIKPGFDSDGKAVQAQAGEFTAASPDVFLKTIEMFLQHIAFTSRTPVRYFLQSDRGGRGDSPSGESLQVEDKPLNDKVARKQRQWGNRHVQVARLVSTQLDGVNPSVMRLAEPVWQDPRYDFRLAVLTEAVQMIAVGLPFKWVIRQMNLTQAEISEIEKLKEKELEEQRAEQKADLSMQKEFQPDPTTGAGSPSSATS